MECGINTENCSLYQMIMMRTEVGQQTDAISFLTEPVHNGMWQSHSAKNIRVLEISDVLSVFCSMYLVQNT